MIQIRRFEKDDAQEVSDLICTILRQINSRDYPKVIIDKMCEYFSSSRLIELAEERLMFVAHDSGKVVGTASLKGDIVLTVFVDANLQGKGIGTKLMERIEATAREKNYKSLTLPSSVTSVGFYKKLGYREIERKVEAFGENVIMEKSL